MTDKIIINKLNETFLQLECSQDQGREIYEMFSCYVPNWKFMPLVKSGVWNGKTSFFDYNNFTIPYGALNKLIQFCKSYNYSYELTFDHIPSSKNITDEEIERFLKEIFPVTSKYQPRDYQITAIKELIKNSKAMIELPTASGKSLIIYSIVRYLLSKEIKGKFIIIVPNINLVQQLRQDCIDYGFKEFDEFFGSIYFDSSNKDLSKQFLISTWQSLQNLPQSFMNQIECVFVDEIHSASWKSKLIVKILSKLVNCKYKFGCSGTLPKEKINLHTLIYYIGEIVSKVKSSELIEQGFLSKIQVVNILLKYPNSMLEKNGNYQDEVEKVINYNDRNKIFKYIINRVGQKNILILVQRISHLRMIKEYLQREFPNKKIYDVYGKTPSDEREIIRKVVNESKEAILCATFKTLSTGVNIPNLNCVIFGSSYKDQKTVCQSIGRGLRKTEIKNNMTLFDICDDLTWQKRTGVLGTNFLYLHFLERLRIYQDQGFPYKNIKLNISDL